MSAPKYNFDNKALQAAANLRKGVFRRSAEPPAVDLPVAPHTLPVPRYPAPDNSFVTVNGSKTSFLLQRDGLSYVLSYDGRKRVFAVNQMVDPKTKKFDGRQMSQDEAIYALKLLKHHLGDADCAFHQEALTDLEDKLPDTPFPDTKAQYGSLKYTFNRYGYQYRVSIQPPYKCEIAYREGDSGSFNSRPMRSDEIGKARLLIASDMTLEEAARQRPFFEALQEQQYATHLNPKAP